MKYFLAKTDPETYSIDDLAKDRRTVWSGVRNPQAVKALKLMRAGDRVLIYHSQGQGAIVGLAAVAGKNRPDPKDGKSWLVDFKFLKKFAEPFVTLKDVKASKEFENFALVRQSRLSTMEIPSAFVGWLKRKGLMV